MSLSKNLIHEVIQAAGAVEDIVQAAPLLFIDFTVGFIQEELGKAANDVQSGAEVVGDTLCLGGR